MNMMMMWMSLLLLISMLMEVFPGVLLWLAFLLHNSHLLSLSRSNFKLLSAADTVM